MRSATSNFELLASDDVSWLSFGGLKTSSRSSLKLAAEILPDIRKRVLRKFHYSLIYTIEKNRVLILAVAHHSRRPGYWVGRRSDR